MGPRDTLQQFVESMTQLIKLMQHETEVVRARDYTKLESIQRQKSALYKSYDNSQNMIQKDLSILDALPKEERSELRALYARFREVLSENMLALKASQDAADRAVNGDRR